MAQERNGMTQKKTRKYSLSYRTLWTVVISCVILGVTAIAIGLQFYYTELNSQYIQHASDIAVFARQSATRGADPAGFAERVMDIYRSLSGEQRNMTGTEEYRALFSEADAGKGSAYDVLFDVLNTFVEAGEVDDVYLGMYDRATCALVYMVDPQEENRFYTGEWETVEAEEVEQFLTWDGNGLLYNNGDTEKYGWLSTSGVPLRNEQGEVCAFILVDVTREHIKAGLVNFAVGTSLALLAVTALISWFLYRYIRKHIVKPLNALAGAASAYAQDKRDGSAAADHFGVSLDMRGATEMENLRLTMSGMEKDISDHEETIKKDAAEKERINTELDLARNIQTSMLPMIFPSFPDRTEFSLYASMTPAKEVGGDFYDFFLIDSDHLALVIADVSGKGIPAAMFMMMSKTLIMNHLMAGCDPAAALERVNRQLCEHNESKMFVTVWLAVLELSTGKGLVCNAGHDNPVLKRADGKFELLNYPHSMFVGAFKKAKYQNREFELRPGDCVFVYTDGVPEAVNAKEEMFGEEGLVNSLNERADAEPEELIRRVHEAVDCFAGSVEQFDDITMLCIQYFGIQNQA